ncbi:ABC transporter ATP-binding protein [Deferribacter autotrophicus]|uniref:ABC transporter ATP-binding protein n=1 Tax=Deferribacter autotrophicus TaxID=500465 RepID=A0A5A8EZR6_9BACT|nr:ABC transporter ATP-binding protein [Deferribacter autotrophicus]KAA0257032.1 ABC transporter ATP-binding protein [Deferribacter autotrophicus]
MISIDGLSFSYDKEFGLEIPNMIIEDNYLHVLIGPNGSGKSTFAKILTGMIRNYSGKVAIDGTDITKLKYDTLSKKITYMNKRLLRDYNISVYEFVSFGRFPHKKTVFFELNSEDKDKIFHALENVDLNNKWDKMLYELSDGEIQRAYLAKVLCQETKYAILDEPTSNLDLKHIKDFLDLLVELKKKITFIVILHNINEALTVFDKLIAFNDGKIDFIWNGIEDFNLQKLKNLYNIPLKSFSNNEKYIVYF